MTELFYEQYKKLPFNYFLDIEYFHNKVLIDFFNSMFFAYYKDTKTKRTEGKKVLELNIEVYNLELFLPLKIDYERLLNFVTSEKWKVIFKLLPENKRNKYQMQCHLFKSDIKRRTSKFNSVTLFSGGLDSFTGLYNSREEKTRYITFKNSGPEVHSLNKIIEFRKEILKKEDDIKEFALDHKKKEQLTQRTRSLFYISLGVAQAYLDGTDKVNLHENGLLSLNPAIKGSKFTTKSTHPKTLYLYNLILKKLNININVSNEDVFKTKGEMVKNLSEIYLEQIKNTMTCGRSRSDRKFHNSKKANHCGVCIPCLLRKITMCSNDYEKYDANYVVGYNTSIFEGSKKDEKYISSVYHFKNFKNCINNGTIYSYIDFNNKFYADKDYKEKTQRMFEKFSKEIDYFFKKYGILEKR